MKVNELREVIKKYNETEKDKIIVELYKRIPKYVKEDYSIDDYIVNMNSKVEKENTKPSMETLEKEVKYFIQCANNDLYVRPNKIISKTERSISIKCIRIGFKNTRCTLYGNRIIKRTSWFVERKI